MMNADGKVTKEAADYGDSSAPAVHRCGICEYYMPPINSYNPTVKGAGLCTKVEGSILPMYGCKLFSKDLIVAATDPLSIVDHPPRCCSEEAPMTKEKRRAGSGFSQLEERVG